VLSVHRADRPTLDALPLDAVASEPARMPPGPTMPTDVRLLRTWSGVIAWTDDVSPILGESEVPGLYTIVVGSSGYTLSPLFARMLAEQIVSGTPLPLEYSPERRTPA